jgi:hypothetical protein
MESSAFFKSASVAPTVKNIFTSFPPKRSWRDSLISALICDNLWKHSARDVVLDPTAVDINGTGDSPDAAYALTGKVFTLVVRCCALTTKEEAPLLKANEALRT